MSSPGVTAFTKAAARVRDSGFAPFATYIEDNAGAWEADLDAAIQSSEVDETIKSVVTTYLEEEYRDQVKRSAGDYQPSDDGPTLVDWLGQAAEHLRMDGHTAAAEAMDEALERDWASTSDETILDAAFQEHFRDYEGKLLRALVDAVGPELPHSDAATEDEDGGGDEADPAVAEAREFEWAAGKADELEAALGPDWKLQLGDRLDQMWGKDWEFAEDSEKLTVLEDLIPLMALPFAGLTDEELAEMLNGVNARLWDEMNASEKMTFLDEQFPGLMTEVYHALTGELEEIAQESNTPDAA
jgi:hypothetical protein